MLLGLSCLGCPAKPDTAMEELVKCRQQIDSLRHEEYKLRIANAEQQKMNQTLLALGDKRLELLFHVKAVELGNYTGGMETAKGVDEGIRVYLKPIDQDGSVLKAAGSVKIQFFDLAAPSQENLVGTYDFPVEQIGKFWASGFLTYHYHFNCKWQTVPRNRDITVIVIFTEYLTGKTFSAQKVVSVKLLPATSPASAPTSAPAP